MVSAIDLRYFMFYLLFIPNLLLARYFYIDHALHSEYRMPGHRNQVRACRRENLLYIYTEIMLHITGIGRPGISIACLEIEVTPVIRKK